MEEKQGDSSLCHITLDDREDPAIIQAFHTLNYIPEIKRLTIGDVVCETKQIVIERKAAHDLIASINDGRLVEQLVRMEQNFPHSFLIIVGDPVEYASQIGCPYTTRHHIGELASLAVRYKTKIIQVKDNNEFASLCLAICSKIDDGKTVELPIIKTNPANVPLSVLCQIAGVSRKKGEALLAYFGSLRNIIEAGEGDLQEVKGIGKELARRIKETFV